jgi:hypothetical protein
LLSNRLCRKRRRRLKSKLCRKLRWRLKSKLCRKLRWRLKSKLCRKLRWRPSSWPRPERRSPSRSALEPKLLGARALLLAKKQQDLARLLPNPRDAVST